MIKDEFISLKVSSISRYSDYYKEKGYSFPTKIDTRGKERLDNSKDINIRINDLPLTSNIKVVRVCDICKEEKSVHYFSILRQRERTASELDLCKPCTIREGIRLSNGLKLDSQEKFRKEFIRCEEKYYENYQPKDFNINSNVSVLWKCSDCQHKWKTRISDRTLGKSKCPNCSNRILNENTSLVINYPLLLDEWDYDKNNINPLLLTSGSHEIVWWKCSSNHTWKTPVHSRTAMKSGCPECVMSKGEKSITDFLTNNIKYQYQKSYDGLIGIGGKLLSYDFYIPSLNTLIEYQGEFHDGFGGKGNEYITGNLDTQKEHDKRKREYALINNIKLLEIWYWDFNNIEEILKKELFI